MGCPRHSCNRLEELAASLPARQETSTSENELCAVCQRIDFVDSIQAERPEDEEQSVVLVHFHVGPLKGVQERSWCPGCRLILAASGILPPEEEADPATTNVVVQQRLFAHEYQGPDGMANKVLEQMKGIGRRAHQCAQDKISWTNSLGILEVVLQPAEISAAVAGGIALSERQMLEDPLSFGKTTPDEDIYRTQASGRVVQNTLNLGRIKEWMSTCTTDHVECRVPATGSGDHTIRVIDIQELRVVSANTSDQYVALSYVWGTETPPLLTRATLSQYSDVNGLEHANIPHTIRDAMKFVEAIGLRYLWVDSLCIVQDDMDDKNSQLPIMSNIYSAAYLVAIAAAGPDADSGIPGVGETDRASWQYTARIDGKEFITVQPSMNQILSMSSWNTRGWTFQEAMLSKRCIVFTQNLIYWSCRTDSWREDIVFESPQATVQLNFTNSLWGIHGNFAGSATTTQGMSPCRSAKYLDMVQRFSFRRFKEDSDALWAFMGVMELQQAALYPRGFIWGHPHEALDVSLLWKQRVFGCGHAHMRRAKHRVRLAGAARDLPFPSWSWLSPRDAVTFHTHCGELIVSQVTWHDPVNFGKADGRWLQYVGGDVVVSETGPDPGESDRHDASLAPPDGSESFVMDYGLLCFTAKSAKLSISLASPDDPKKPHGDDDDDDVKLLETIVHDPAGEEIGRLKVPETLFTHDIKVTGEFILLSSNCHKEVSESCQMVREGPETGDLRHVKGCEHIYSHNLMMVTESAGVHRRLGLTTVDDDKWKNIETAEKQFILA